MASKAPDAVPGGGGETVSAAAFLQEWPLYRPLKGTWSVPSTISLDCPVCKKETSWGMTREDASALSRYFLYQYICHLCRGAYSTYLLYVTNDSVVKIGQFPAPSAKIPNQIESRLGASAIFYRRALTSRNQGYGLGAVAYLRRVIENKTNELIDVVIESAQSMGVPIADVEKIRSAKSEKIYEDKIRIAVQALPDAMKPGGVNPLQTLYDLLSIGLHTQSDEECVQIADEIREVFDYLFDRLRAEIDDRQRFVAKIQQIAGSRTGKRK
jgi:hypothetical protein